MTQRKQITQFIEEITEFIELPVAHSSLLDCLAYSQTQEVLHLSTLLPNAYMRVSETFSEYNIQIYCIYLKHSFKLLFSDS